MAAGVRFTKAEREFLTRWLEDASAPGSNYSPRETKLAAGMLDKLTRSELTKGTGTAAGIGWQRAADAMRVVLGNSLALPPRPDVGWITWMSNRIRALGLTETDCQSIAKVVVAKGWRGPYSFESLIKGADRHLAEAQLPLPLKKQTSGWEGPVKVDDL